MNSPQYLVLFYDAIAKVWELTVLIPIDNSLNCQNILTATTKTVAEIASDHWMKRNPGAQLITNDSWSQWDGRHHLLEFAKHGTLLLKRQQSTIVGGFPATSRG